MEVATIALRQNLHSRAPLNVAVALSMSINQCALRATNVGDWRRAVVLKDFCAVTAARICECGQTRPQVERRHSVECVNEIGTALWRNTPTTPPNARHGPNVEITQIYVL